MEGMWCTVIKQTFALIHGGWSSTWGLVLDMCHRHEQPLLIFWTNYPNVLVFMILVLDRQQDEARASQGSHRNCQNHLIHLPSMLM